jgi:hypothetical protein
MVRFTSTRIGNIMYWTAWAICTQKIARGARAMAAYRTKIAAQAMSARPGGMLPVRAYMGGGAGRYRDDLCGPSSRLRSWICPVW